MGVETVGRIFELIAISMAAFVVLTVLFQGLFLIFEEVSKSCKEVIRCYK